MSERFPPAAYEAITIPSISECGVFCISSRSLNVPGSDSSALHTRYLSIEPFGRDETFVPLAKAAPAPPRVPHQDLANPALRQERALRAHREAGAATAADARRFELLEHLFRSHRERPS